MQHKDSDIVILKPTAKFLAFLEEQLPEAELPDLRTLRTDHTAYSIVQHETDEETLDEIERNFPYMFQHEIARLLGIDACKGIEVSFLDFLCCFKFEMHSQIVIMESSLQDARQLLCIKPRSVLLNWVNHSTNACSNASHSAFETEEVVERLSLRHLTDNATVLVKNFNQLSEVKPFVQQYYKPIVKAEMLRMSDIADQWPVIDSFEMFRRYFAIEIHTQLIHLNL